MPNVAINNVFQDLHNRTKVMTLKWIQKLGLFPKPRPPPSPSALTLDLDVPAKGRSVRSRPSSERSGWSAPSEQVCISHTEKNNCLGWKSDLEVLEWWAFRLILKSELPMEQESFCLSGLYLSHFVLSQLVLPEMVYSRTFWAISKTGWYFSSAAVCVAKEQLHVQHAPNNFSSTDI